MQLRFVSGLMLAVGMVSPADAGPNIVIAAASSLSEVLPKIYTAWDSGTKHPATFTFESSSRLARQISDGLAVDIFFSADEEWLDFLIQKGKIDHPQKRNILSNDLVLIAPSNSEQRPTSAREVDFSKLNRLAIAGENVPAGKYAIATLKNLKAWNSVEKHLIYGDNVRTVLNWVVNGNVPFGIVYYSDALAVPEKVRIIVKNFDGLHPEIVYSAGILKTSAKLAEASSFLDYFRSPNAKAILATAGFRSSEKK